jgi:curved DNA-binding protein CbpA
MNYYEEFGLGPGASTEEVRQAYRTLVRLLHPDTQPDDRLRAVAERQMKRLNEILATLTDPQKRRQYDDTLRSATPRTAAARPARNGEALGGLGNAVVILPAKQAAWKQAAVRHWFYILIGLAWLATAVAWYAVPRAPSPAPIPAAAPEEDAAPAKSAVAGEKPPRTSPTSRRTAKRPAEKPKRAARAAAVQPATPQQSAPAAHFSASLPPPEPVPEPVSGLPETRGASPIARPPGSPFAGSWLYTPQSTERAIPGRYRALYIECLLREEAGEIVGTYRAKYKVPDQAISPEVAFRVRGATPAGTSGRVVWTASDGARGMIELTLRSPGSLDVVWWTTVAGRRPALSSGEAVLIRQMDRPGGL